MYDRVQKSSSSWNPSPIQKKKSSKYGPRTFTVQPRRQTKSSQTPVPKYSPDPTNKRFVTLVGSIEYPAQRQADALTLQPKSEQEAAPVEEAVTVQEQAQEVEIQRQCKECQEEEKDSDEMSSLGVQAKLTVGAPGDKYEQEADRVAAQVMSMSVATDNSPQVQRFGKEDNPVQGWSLAQSITPVVQRRVDEHLQMRSMVQRAFQPSGNQASGDLESRLNASKGGGSPLAPEVRAFMEPRFGADFARVRVHTGASAVQMNRELGAQAFTYGSDVYFGAGKSPGNNELTAHELTHVVQQTGSVQGKLVQRNAEVYVWNPHVDGYGHAAIKLSNGSYISWWPAGGGTTKQQYWTGRPGGGHSYADDIGPDGEGKGPDHTYDLGNNCLDETAMWNWYNTNFAGAPNPKWSVLRNSCSDVAHQAINAGSSFTNPCYLSLSHSNMFWTPKDLGAYADCQSRWCASKAAGPLNATGRYLWENIKEVPVGAAVNTLKSLWWKGEIIFH